MQQIRREGGETVGVEFGYRVMVGVTGGEKRGMG